MPDPVPDQSADRSTHPCTDQTVSHPTLDLGCSLITVVRAVGRVRDGFRAIAVRGGLDWSSFALLRTLVRDGPARVTALADSVHLAPSTVSRMINHLIDEGFVERRSDSGDGRASIIAVTTEGLRVHEQLRRVRDDYLNGLLRDWSDTDRLMLTQLLARFAADLEAETGLDHAEAVGGARPHHRPGGHPCDLTSMGSS